MKKMILFLSLITSSGFAKEQMKQDVLANRDQDFIILSDVETSEFTIFLSYAGSMVNHCGIAFRSHSYGVKAADLVEILDTKVMGGEVLILNDRLVSRLSPDIYTYGHFFNIKTKSGLPLNQAMQSLKKVHKAEVIVEILPCK